MKKPIIAAMTVIIAAAGLWLALSRCQSEWTGVDETVVEKIAAAAGRPPREPFINTDQGDLLLFFFLIAGSAGGFVGGYYFRELFPPRSQRGELDRNV